MQCIVGAFGCAGSGNKDFNIVAMLVKAIASMPGNKKDVQYRQHNNLEYSCGQFPQSSVKERTSFPSL